MPTLAIYGIVALVLYAAGALSGWRVESWHRDSLEVAAQKATDLQIKHEQDKQALAARTYELQRENAVLQAQSTQKTVDRIITRTLYSRSCFDPDGVLATNQALTGKTADPAGPNPGLPGPKPAPGRPGLLGTKKAQ